jgi:hypothetical protein
MKIWIKPIAAAVALTGLALVAPRAEAGCGWPMTGTMKPMVYLGGDSGGLVKTDYESAGFFGIPTITGMWQFNFISDGTHPGPAAGMSVDAGYVVWHDDGTEIMNSGRAPVSSAFCLGVWRQVGLRTYKLTHWALSWIPGYVPGVTQSWSGVGGVDGAFQPAGPTNIQETVVLSADGNSYTGKFTLTAYLYDGKAETDANSNAGPPQVITGTIKATRIKP